MKVKPDENQDCDKAGETAEAKAFFGECLQQARKVTKCRVGEMSADIG